MMDAERYDRLHELFAATCDLEPQQRAALLDRECVGDPQLRQEVETSTRTPPPASSSTPPLSARTSTCVARPPRGG